MGKNVLRLAFAIREEHTTTEEARELRAFLTSKEGYELSTPEYIREYKRLLRMESKLLTLQSHIIELTEEVNA